MSGIDLYRIRKGAPIPLILHCPVCHKQHIDEVDEDINPGWTNPPHISHKCLGCGNVWSPSTVPTEGVKCLPAHSLLDTWPAIGRKPTLLDPAWAIKKYKGCQYTIYDNAKGLQRCTGTPHLYERNIYTERAFDFKKRNLDYVVACDNPNCKGYVGEAWESSIRSPMWVVEDRWHD